MGLRERRSAASEKQSGDEREDVDTTTLFRNRWIGENLRRRNSTTSSPHIQQRYSPSIGSNHMNSELLQVYCTDLR